MRKSFSLLLLLLFLRCTKNPSSVTDNGGGSGWETKTVVGTAVYPNGDPAGSAVARLRGSEFVYNPAAAEIPVKGKSDVTVDDSGCYRFTNVGTDAYRIEIIDSTGRGALVDCIVTEDDTVVRNGPDTLKCLGKITGGVVVQEVGDSAKSIIYLYGMDRMSFTNANGMFCFDDLPEGEYRLRVVPDSTETMAFDFGGIRVDSCATTRVGNLSLPSVAFFTTCADPICDMEVITAILEQNGFHEDAVEGIVDTDEISGRVTGLDLTGLGILELPPDIARLEKLRKLLLVNNRLNTLPVEIGFLTNLRVLDIAGNSCSTLPPQVELLDSLRYFSARSNSLDSVPSALQGLHRLEMLVLSDNFIRNVPSWITRLNVIKVLDLRGNALVELPKELGSIKNLQSFDCSENNLTKIPGSFAGAENLEVFVAGGNRLGLFPTKLMTCSSLRYLDLSGNLITELPLKVPHGLRHLFVDDNYIETFPYTLVENAPFKSLAIGGNRICGVSAGVKNYLDSLCGDWQSTQKCR